MLHLSVNILILTLNEEIINHIVYFVFFPAVIFHLGLLLKSLKSSQQRAAGLETSGNIQK